MKKLVMFGLAAATVCAVNAASFSWSAAVNGVDGDGNTLTSTANAATFVLVYLGNGTADWDNATVVQTGTWSIGANKGTYAAKVSGTYLGDGEGGFANGNIYGVMVKDDQGGLHKVTGTTTYTISGYNGLDTWSGDAFTFATSNFVADKASYPAGGGSGGVPEPTSGLLLVVGGAMLALRRKQK